MMLNRITLLGCSETGVWNKLRRMQWWITEVAHAWHGVPWPEQSNVGHRKA